MAYVLQQHFGVRTVLLLRCSRLNATPVLKRNRQEQRAYDRDRYHARHLIEHFFCTLKQYRAIATRDDKTARNSLAAVSLTSTVITLNRGHPLVLQRHFRICVRFRQYERGRMTAFHDRQGSTNDEVSL